MQNLLPHLALAVVLFLAINWIGGHARSIGYISLTLFVQRDSAPAFNVLFRLAGPVVFTTIASALLYSMSLDAVVKDIWHIAVYATAIRIGYNVLMGRALLLNWPKELALNALSISLTWLAYENFIKQKKTLLPDFSTATNEFWVFIGVFLYLILNSIDTGVSGSERRKAKYLKEQERHLRRSYGHILDTELPGQFGNSIAMSILIYEEFNRPRVIQSLERMVFPRFSKTLGPMQVATPVRVTDAESVRLGCQKIAASYALFKTKAETRRSSEWSAKYSIVGGVASDYNKDDSYVQDIRMLQEIVFSSFYPLANLTHENLNFERPRRSY